MTDAATRKAWHVAAWPPLAWLETAIKLVALVIGIVAFGEALDAGRFAVPEGAQLGQLVVLVILSIGLLAAIGDRWIEREIVAMAFVIINNAGHWSMVGALLWGEESHILALFAALMLAGDLVKMLFIAVHREFTVRDNPRLVLYALTGVYVAGYGLILLLEMLR